MGLLLVQGNQVVGILTDEADPAVNVMKVGWIGWLKGGALVRMDWHGVVCSAWLGIEKAVGLTCDTPGVCTTVSC